MLLSAEACWRQTKRRWRHQKALYVTLEIPVQWHIGTQARSYLQTFTTGARNSPKWIQNTCSTWMLRMFISFFVAQISWTSLSDTRFWDLGNWKVTNMSTCRRWLSSACWVQRQLWFSQSARECRRGQIDRSQICSRYVPDFRFYYDFIMNEEFHDYFPPGFKGPGLLFSLHENGWDLMRSWD